MAIADAKRRKIARELIDWIYLGIRVGAARSVAEYERLKATDAAVAEEQLKRAVNMPLRARARINEARVRYEAVNGVGTFNTFLAGCLTLAGSVTLADLDAALTEMETYVNGLIVRKRDGESLDSIAADIRGQLKDDSLDWVFPFPADYADSW